MGRGGQREGAGRKSGWTHSETQTIRVPRIFAAQILEYARQLDTDVFSPCSELVHDQCETSSDPMVMVEDRINTEVDEVPGQISIFEVIDSVSESKIVPLRGDQLAERFGVNRGVPSKMKGKFKKAPERLLLWTKQHDPDGIGWEFDAKTRLYYPLQVNPPWNTGLSDEGAREDMPRKGLTADEPAKLSV
jgi:hypothetical protein